MEKKSICMHIQFSVEGLGYRSHNRGQYKVEHNICLTEEDLGKV